MKETPAARKERIRSERAAKNKIVLEEKALRYQPFTDPKATKDAYRTLFVARLAYETTERKLQREFEAFGPIETVRIVKNALTGQPKGYAFIEFKKEDDLKRAYRRADGMMIDGRRVLVDVERGRTVRGELAGCIYNCTVHGFHPVCLLTSVSMSMIAPPQQHSPLLFVLLCRLEAALLGWRPG